MSTSSKLMKALFFFSCRATARNLDTNLIVSWGTPSGRIWWIQLSHWCCPFQSAGIRKGAIISCNISLIQECILMSSKAQNHLQDARTRRNTILISFFRRLAQNLILKFPMFQRQSLIICECFPVPKHF